jgi:MFS family permease
VASLLVFWMVVDEDSRASLYLLYIWVSLFGAITASQAWSLASHVFNAREARRTFAWIGLGGVVGGIVGGSLARIIAPRLGTEALLPICAAGMGVTVLILQRLFRRDVFAPAEPTETERGDADNDGTVFSRVRKSPYLSMMMGLLFVGVIVEAFIDYEFKAIAHQSFNSKDQMTSFFGMIASYGGMLALFVQTLITGPLLKRFGVGAAILLLPSALLGGFLVVAARPELWAVSLLKLIDGSLSYSVHRSGMELLFVPIPAKLRVAIKGVIDLLVDRIGRAFGGILLLSLTLLSFSVPVLSLVAASALIIWIGIALAVRHKYVDAFRSALEKKVIEPEALEVQALDNTISGALLQALSSEDDRQVLYALNLLSSGNPGRWRKHLPMLLEHKAPAVRSRAIASLTEWRSFAPAHVEKRLLDEDLDVRIEAVRHLCEAAQSRGRIKLKEFLGHPDARIVLAAIHCVAKYRLKDGDLIDEALIESALETSGEHEVNAKTAAARALAITHPPAAPHLLQRLLADSSTAVVQQAIRATGDIGHVDSIPRLIPLLARAPLRREAREALLKIGAPALQELRRRFQDDDTPMDIRARIPKVIALSGRQEGADFLLEHIHRFSARLDTSLLKALNNIRLRREDIHFDAEQVSSLIGTEVERYERMNALGRALETARSQSAKESGEILALLEKAIEERQAESVERVFRLLYLIYSPEDIRSVYFSFNSRPALRASAVEFLDNLINPALRAVVIPLVEERADVSPEGPGENAMSAAEAVRMLLAEDDEWLRTIAQELESKWGREGVFSSRIA